MKHKFKLTRLWVASLLLFLGISPNAWAGQYNLNWQGKVYFRAPDNWDLNSYSTVQAALARTTATDSKTYIFYFGKMTRVGSSRLYYLEISANHDGWNQNEYIFFTANSNEYGSGDFNVNGNNCYTTPKDYGCNNSSNYYLFNPDSEDNGATVSASWNSDRDKLVKLKQDIKLYTGGSSSNAGGSVKITGYYFTSNTSVTSGNKTSSSASVDYETAVGSTVTLEATPATGYQFDGWYTASTGGTQESSDATYTYTCKGTKTLYARFSAKSYDITYSPAAAPTGCSYTSAPTSGTFGSTVSMTITPATGYTVSVTSTDVSISQNGNVYSFTMPAKAVTINVSTTEVLTSVTISSNGNGTVSPANASVGVATTESVSATPATGYHFASWAVTGNADIKSLTTTNPVTLYGNGSGSTGTLAATFAETTYSITVAAGANGSVASASVSAGQITSVALPTATPNDGYNFKNWTATEGITITNPTSADGATIKATKAGTVTANFENAATYSLTVAAGTGIASVTGSQDDITLGQSYPITATVKAGYTWSGWAKTSGAGTAAFADASSQNTNVTVTVGSVEVTASATPNTNTAYTVKHYQQNLADDDYTLVDTDNLTGTTDASVTPAVKDYTGFTAPSTQMVTIKGDGTTEVTYNYTRNSYTLTWAGLEGATTQGGTLAGSVKYGATLTAPTVSKTGYNFTGWSPAVPATMPAANSTYTAQWSEILYTITLTNATAASVQAGIATHPSITANAAPVGQKFKQWNTTGGATVASTTSASTTVTATAEGTITAEYEDVPTVFFKNTLGWSNVYVIFFNEDAYREWDNIQGVHPHRGKDRVAEYGTLTLVPGTTDIYYCSYDAAKITTGYIAFSNADMHTWDDFSGNKASYRGDFASCQPLFIPNTNQTSKDNNTEYYSDGRWTSYSTASEIYMVGIDGDWSERPQYQFEKETITGTSYTLDVTLSEVGHNYTFKLRKCGDGEWYGVAKEETAITSNHCTDIQFFGGNDYANCTLISTVAGTYTFTYDITTKKLSVEYPAMPAPASITVTKERYFGEDKINTFIETSPAYKVYTDEQIKLTIDEVAAPTGCTTYYQFGENAASTERTYTISNITNTASSIEAKVFFRPNSGGKDGDAKSETIAYQGVNKPSLSLTTSWSTHNDEAQEGVDVPNNVTVYYSAGNYDGPATVTRSKDGADPVTFMTIESGEQANKTYTLENQNVQRQTFVATATVNGRTFTATKTISVYRLVEITITDEDHLMTNYYMWENGTNPTREEQAWPGKSFFSTLGNAHIFYVKYPSYTHFVLNNGKQAGEGDAIQTVDVELPDQSTCYAIGEQVTGEEDPDKGKYQVETAECPNKLYVGDIAPVSALQGEGVLVSPQVDIDPLLNADDLRITFNYKGATGITCDQRGRSFMVTATSTGAKSISVTYSIEGAKSVTKDVTVNVTNAIMVQVKVPTSFNWNDHNDMWVYYFGHGAEGHIRMSWKDCVDSHDRFSARVPLGTDDNKVNFLFHEWTLDGNKPWQQTTDIKDVSTDGCYTLSDGGEGQKRNWTRNGNDCWTEYYVEIDMNNGTVYRSNKVEDLANTVSFYAPTSDKGSIRIMQNGTQKTVISSSDHQTLFATAGVYTAKITNEGAGLSDVNAYTGDYYIRTDGAKNGWNNYVDNAHAFQSFTLFDGALYDHYWVECCKKVDKDGNLNIKACVANEYNENLANMIESDTYTDEYGSVVGNTSTGINLRFGYNPATNYFERAALTGSTSEGNKFLNIIGSNVYNDQAGQQELNVTNYNDHPEYSKMEDDGDWIYEKTVFVKIDLDHGSSQIYLKSLINGKELYQLGYKTDNFGRKTSELKERTIMGQGSSNGEYALRIVYDFKQNRILSSWSPIGELKVNENLTIDADVMFIRHENEGTAHIIFENKSAKVTSLQNVYFVLELDKYVEPENERNYWFTVPFDVKVGDIFGVENYVTLDADNEAIDGSWGILRYDGYTRSKKGWFIEDTPEGFWEWMDKDEVLTAGTGYVLVFDKQDFEWKEFEEVIPCDDPEDEQCIEGKKTIIHAIKRIYFPSQAKGFSMSNASENSIIYADEPCTITKPVNRTKEDSNWKVIGPMSYNDIKVLESDVATYEGGKAWPNFLYLYEENKEKGSRYTPTQGYGEGFTYQAFHGYMTQYAGTITWKDMSVTNPSSAPRFAEEPEFKGGTMTIELVQNNEQLDRTFVNLSKNGTEGFDQNLDLTKITENCAQIASVSEDVLYAGNTLPLDIEMVPLNVKVVANGTYDIALAQSLEGLEVRLYDAFEQTTTPLDLMSATVTLEKGEYKDRFFLQFVQKSPLTPTNLNGAIEQFNLPTDKTQKLLINDNIYLINAGRIYNVLGVGE